MAIQERAESPKQYEQASRRDGDLKESEAPKGPVSRIHGTDLEVYRRFNSLVRQQLEAFASVFGASVDMVIPRGAPDLRMAGGMSWRRWEQRRLEQAFRAGRITMAEARAHEKEKIAERSAWRGHWRKVQRGWAKWLAWRVASPGDAETFREQHDDGQVGWLLELAARRTPLGKRTKRTMKRDGEKWTGGDGANL